MGRMNCPKCHHFNTSKVLITVPTDTAVWRVRKCDICGHKWSTGEMEDEPAGETVEQLRNRVSYANKKR